MSERVVETEFVFDRLQAAELSAAYRILVPERPSRSVRAAQSWRPIPATWTPCSPTARSAPGRSRSK